MYRNFVQSRVCNGNCSLFHSQITTGHCSNAHSYILAGCVATAARPLGSTVEAGILTSRAAVDRHILVIAVTLMIAFPLPPLVLTLLTLNLLPSGCDIFPHCVLPPLSVSLAFAPTFLPKALSVLRDSL